MYRGKRELAKWRRGLCKGGYKVAVGIPYSEDNVKKRVNGTENSQISLSGKDNDWVHKVPGSKKMRIARGRRGGKEETLRRGEKGVGFLCGGLPK